MERVFEVVVVVVFSLFLVGCLGFFLLLFCLGVGACLFILEAEKKFQECDMSLA